MPQSFASLHCHIIFSTKNRAPSIESEWQPRLFAYFGGTLKEYGSQLIAAGGIADHVHLLVSLSREVAVAEAVRVVKANSSRWIHETFAQHGDFAWQTGYGAFAVSYSNLECVKRYLANQAEHHQKRTFQEEFIHFLNRHHITYDEKHLWE
jgi:REP element-mobilizing transposase RayT